ncbi:MAG: glycosyltransferase family 2 protein [Parvibaculum sp.]
MAKITVGVPVFNGAASLRACLECLRDQTFRDLEVLISDNGSQDESVAIAQAFVDSDPRFRLIRHPVNIGARRNFLSVLEAATTKYFMWRADDAISDANYLACLTELHEAMPGLGLAVGRERIIHADGSLWREAALQRSDSTCRARRIGRVLLKAHPNFIYGLWERDYLTACYAEVMTNYPHLWAWDHATTFAPIIDERIAGTSGTCLISSINISPREPVRLSARNMIDVRRSFRATCFVIFSKRHWRLLERLVLSFYIWRYANRKSYRFFKSLRRYLREVTGTVKSSKNRVGA